MFVHWPNLHFKIQHIHLLHGSYVLFLYLWTSNNSCRLTWCVHGILDHWKWTRNKEDMISRNKGHLKKTWFVFLLCYSFASRVETYNVELSLMFRIKDFEVHKRTFVYILMDLIMQCIYYFGIISGLHFQ
jgi:hypothetical protein